MEKKTIELYNISTGEVTSNSAANYVKLLDASGKEYRISLDNLAPVMAKLMPQMADGVFVAYHTAESWTSSFIRAVRPDEWASVEASGKKATGILLVEGGRHLLIALDEAPSAMYWGSGSTLVGSALTDKTKTFEDFTGKSRTASIVASDAYSADGDSYAPGFCSAYSRLNDDGSGLAAGKWWLPSIGELAMIWANFKKINYALSKVSGATLLQATSYWSSTEHSAADAWLLYLSDGHMNDNGKSTLQYRVRAVSAFLNS